MRTPPFSAAFSFFVVGALQTADEISLDLHDRAPDVAWLGTQLALAEEIIEQEA